MFSFTIEFNEIEADVKIWSVCSFFIASRLHLCCSLESTSSGNSAPEIENRIRIEAISIANQHLGSDFTKENAIHNPHVFIAVQWLIKFC